MKTIFKTAILMIVALLALNACNSNPMMSDLEIMDSMVNIKSVTGFQASESPIWAGQNVNAGSLIITNDAQNLYVTYSLTNGWLLNATHLHIASNLAGIPKNRQGIPIPGQFAYSNTFDPRVTEYTYQFSLASLNLTYGSNIVVAAHAEVVKPLSDNTLQKETAWGGANPGGGPRWWHYANFTVIAPPTNPDPVFNTETAMLRMNDMPNDFSNPWGTHPWFTYVNLIPESAQQTFYFYAAQHYRVGEAKIWKDAGFMYVKIDLDAPYKMSETHLNVQLQGYSGNPAFGLFPYTATHDPLANTYTYQVPWQAVWNNADLKVALHGVVGPF